MMTAGSSAHAQQERAMATACTVYNDNGYRVPGGSAACTPYADGIWVTIQGNWSDNDYGQALDATCRKFMAKTMQNFALNGMIFRLTEIDNRERQVTTTCQADAAPVTTAATAPTYGSSSRVIADYVEGHYYVRGSIDGRGWGFAVDTGANGSVIDRKDIGLLGDAQYLGMVNGQLADGSQTQVPVYLIHNVCVGNACVRDLQVMVSDGVTLLGTDFIEASGVSVSIKNNVMTLAAE
jgi:predicted aspartyl protease